MLKIRILFGFLLLGAGLMAQKPAIITKQGSTVYVHTSNQGPNITYGQTVLLDVDTWINDSLIQGTQRDNGGPREIEIPDSSEMKRKIPAVFEALFLMTKGDSATVIQPVDSFMARAIPKELGEVKVIRYEVKVVDVPTPEFLAARKTQEEKEMEVVKGRGVAVGALTSKTLADYKANKLGPTLKKTASGLEYVVLEQGSGAAIKDGDMIETHYYGVLKSDGTMFDNSFERGASIPFEVGILVPGFNEGMKLLNRGGKAILFIPSGLGYGDEEIGPIPASSDLVFYIELK
jgi:FKBP-type peptidyl-prolyl cis-trans isomerase FkpA